jgi:TolB protein
MKPKRLAPWLAVAAVLAIALARQSDTWAQEKTRAATSPVGVCEGRGDIGTVLHPGSVEFDGAKDAYTIAGSGENMWFGKDAFQFAWKKASGDVTLTADISFLGKGVNEHRKAVLMIRQSLDADSPYADR